MTIRTLMTAAVIAAWPALLAIPAAAADGERLIDQARVNAGGITLGDAPGFPATLSRPGRYKLTGNLRVAAGVNGIEVSSTPIFAFRRAHERRTEEPVGAGFKPAPTHADQWTVGRNRCLGSSPSQR